MTLAAGAFLAGTLTTSAAAGPVGSKAIRAQAKSQDIDLRDLPVVTGAQADATGAIQRGGPRAPRLSQGTSAGPLGTRHDSEGAGLRAGSRAFTSGLNFEGQSSGALPLDPIGDVGPSHYLQAINTTFAIYDKANGSVVAGPSNINSLWAGAGGQCETHNSGDPVVMFDQFADRFILAQFTAPDQDELCVAVSKTSNPVTGGWWLYEFSTGVVYPDYFKMGVWHDAFYLAWNEGSTGTAAMSRDTMLTGGVGTIVIGPDISGPLGADMMLPSDADGESMPPAARKNAYYRFVDGEAHGGVDRIEIFEADATFGGSPSLTVTGPQSIPVSAFSSEFCGVVEFSLCIPQPGTSQKLDVIMEWPMWRFQYRNFGVWESLVGNFTFDTNGADHAGIRWFELRREAGGPWTLEQEGTQSPDAVHRWMGSVALNGLGHIALGYSASDATSVFPSLRYSGRLASAPAGTFPIAESTLVAGTSSQTSPSGRWGDYAAMTVDPVDDCTFWFTGEYHSGGGKTRIGSFSLCTSTTKAVDLTAKPGRVEKGSRSKLTATVAPCEGHEGDDVVFQRKKDGAFEDLAVKPTDGDCVASMRLRINRRTTVRAVSPKQDTDHGAGTSAEVKIRLR